MRKTIALTLFCCIVTTLTYAQFTLNEVQVYSKSIERKGINPTALNTTVIPDSVIKASIGSTLSELLGSQLGVVINGSSQSLGSVQSVYFRGASRGLTLILVNGIPVYDASDISQAFDLNSIPLNTVERIEILKGGQSVVYGSDAVAGVINIITKTLPKNKIEASSMLGIGSFGTYKFNSSLAGKSKGFNFQVGYSTLKSNGISSAKDTLNNSFIAFENDKINQQVFSGIIQQNFNNKLSVNTNIRYSNYNTGLDGGAFIDDADFNSKNKMLQYGLGLNLSLKKGYLVANYLKNISTRSYIDDSISVPTNAYAFYSKANYKSNTDFYEIYTNLGFNSSLNILLGIEYQQFKMRQDYLSISSFGEYRSPEISESSTNLGNTSVYVTTLYKKNKIGFELGGRLNYASTYGFNQSFVFNPYAQFGKLKLFTSFATSYKNPSLYQLFSEYGNNKLNPQNSNTLDVGMAYNYSLNNTISVGYFSRKIKDLIFFNAIDVAPYGQYINLNAQQEAGIELELSQTIKKLFVNLNYLNLISSKTIIKNTNKKTENIDFLRRPKQVLNTSIGYKINPKFAITLVMQNQSKRKDRFYNPATFSSETIELEAFTLLNAIINYQISKRTQLSFTGNNLLNSNYYETYGFSIRPLNFNISALFNY